ncbi:hypothetical protein Pfo_005345 [Paulownia fortunei]|nr:hypothetical protein Pfo_005345 [Paulownia fortunei]
MLPPQNIKKVQQLTGRLAALFKWSEVCQQAFEDLKNYLVSLPLLTKLEMGETLLFYLAASKEEVSVVLVQEMGKDHQVYYVNQTLQGAELKYPNIEKLALTLITAARKLQPYFQLHLQVLSKLKASDRLVKWAVEISEHVLVDFLGKMMTDQATSSTPTWTLYVDGSSTSTRSGAGVLMESSQGDKFQYVIKIEFATSNNKAEYKALVAGIKLAHATGARKLIINSDSQLVVNQVGGSYEAEEEKMIKYLNLMKDLVPRFKECQIIKIPRVENSTADQLAKLVSFIASIKKQPMNSKDAHKLRMRAEYSQPYLKCLTPSKANYILKKIHEGIYGNHLGDKALAVEVLRQGYFWPTMLNYAMDLVQRCCSCQEHANIKHQPAVLLQT